MIAISRGRRLALVGFQSVAFAALTLYAVQSVTSICGAGVNDFFETWVYDGLLAAAAILCFARAFTVPAERSAWAVLGLGLLSWTAGDAYYALYLAPLATPPLPSVSDALWLGFFPACYVAIVLLVRERLREFRSSLWLDGLVGALATSAIGAALVFGAILGGDRDTATVTVDVSYALADLLLIGFVIAVFALTGWRPGRALLMLGAGLFTGALVDGFFLYQSATGTTVGSTLVASLWPLSALLIGCAAWQRPSPSTAVRLDGLRVFAMPSAFAASGLALLAYDSLHSLNDVALALAMATLAAVIVRMAATFRENLRLLAKSRTEALTDALTGLGNRRKLMVDLEEAIRSATRARPTGLMLLDLDGFKHYNDRFGHLLGDALLARVGQRLDAAVRPTGRAYRLGGDEFCVVASGTEVQIAAVAAAAVQALSESGDGFDIQSSCGQALIPNETRDVATALHLADDRLYSQKGTRRRTSVSRETGAALVQALEEREPELRGHLDKVRELSLTVGRKLGLRRGQLEDLARAAQLHDVGKVAVPDTVLKKAGPLDAFEWDFMRQHTIVGERILNAAPTLTSVAKLVRSSHERYDGGGYPDGLAGKEIPLGARIIAACDAFYAMTSPRAYGRELTCEEALDELCRCANAQFDPDVVAVICDVIAARRRPLRESAAVTTPALAGA